MTPTAALSGPKTAGFAVSTDAMADQHSQALARIVETARNGPVRHLYADNGFTHDGQAWRKALNH